LWVTNPLLKEGLEVMRYWGFEYKTIAFIWHKTYKSGKTWFGLGHYTRANAEICLLGIKGRLQRKNKSVYRIIKSPIMEHSRKPDKVRESIVRLFGDLPRIELFARQKTDGWDCWGLEVENGPIVP
jgi:N6-adenosine-specific RNA methylase IME4